MGCNIPASAYRKHHDEAWAYLLDELKPDIALVQEAVVAKMRAAHDFNVTLCDLLPKYDAGTAVLVGNGVEASEVPKISVSSATYVATTKVSTPAGLLNVAAVHVYPGEEQHADLRKIVEVLRSSFAEQASVVGGFQRLSGGADGDTLWQTDVAYDAGLHELRDPDLRVRRGLVLLQHEVGQHLRERSHERRLRQLLKSAPA